MMKHLGFGFVLVISLLLTNFAGKLQAQGTAFTYQGRLNNNGAPATGSYDFRFRLSSDNGGTNYVGSAVATNGLAVGNGLFTATLDFGSPFTGSNYWLQIEVRTNGGGGYSTLYPLQPLTPTPYSIFATSANTVSGQVPASQLTGTLGSANISGTYGSAMTLNNPNNSFSGNGANVSNVNAAALNGLVSSNFWRLGGNNVGSTNDFIGSTNNQSVVVKVNNKQAVRYENTYDTPNIVGGYSGNLIDTNVPGGTIGGGGTGQGNQPNIITNGGDYGTIAGGYRNFISGYGGSILGGSVNRVNNFFGTVGGGQWNSASGLYSFIGGGYSNLVSLDYYSAIVGGSFNTNFGYASTIDGGANNFIGTNSSFNFIGGGLYNFIQPNLSFATIGGGIGSSVGPNATYATIPGGKWNAVNAPNGFAAGTQAIVNHAGSLVMTDGQEYNFSSITTNEFAIRAQNGLRLESEVGVNLNTADRPMITRAWDPFATNAPSYKAGIGRWGLFMEPFNLIIGIPSNDAPGRYFSVAKYSTNGAYTPLMQVDQSGSVSMTGVLRMGSETGTSELPSPAGLLMRRINSGVVTSNSVVAIAMGTNGVSTFLARDGTFGGFIIKYPANAGNLTIACMGIDSTGAQKNFYTSIGNSASAGYVQIYTTAQNIAHFECTFGITYSPNSQLTQVTLSRFTSDYHWSGNVISTVNQ